MKNKVLALVVAIVMIVAMMPFAQTSVYADGTLTEAALLTDMNEVVKSYDTDAELGTINTYGDGTFAISNGVLTLTGNGSEDFVYSAISSFSNESMLHIKINGVTNATHTHPILYLHDRNNPFCTISFQNQAINFGGAAYSDVNTSQPFEMVMKKIVNGSVISYEVYARQNASDNFSYFGNVNTTVGWVYENRFEFYSSGGNSIAIDYVKVYNPKSDVALPNVNAAFASSDYALVKQLILTDYAVCFDITAETMADYNALSDKDSVFTSMTGAPYTSTNAVVTAFATAVAAQKIAQSGSGETITYDELIGNALSNGTIEIGTKFDTDAELGTISTYGDGTFAISDGVLTLSGNGSEDFVYSSISSFSNESMLHIKINGVTGATHTHPILYLHAENNPYNIITFQNQAINFGGTAYDAVNTTQTFEIVMKKIDNGSAISYEVYARQNATDNFIYLGSMNTAAGWVYENRFEFYASGGNSIAIDYIKVYNPSQAGPDDTEPGEIITYDELIGTALSDGAIEIGTKYDTDTELGTISTYGDGTVAISDGVLTLTGNGSEDLVYSSLGSFSNESMLHIKINGVTGATHTHPILYLHDESNPYCLITFQNQTINFGGAAFDAVNTSQPFEIVMKKVDSDSAILYEVYARQNESDNFTYLGDINTTAGWVEANRLEIYASGGNSISIDYIKVYNPAQAGSDDTEPGETKTYDELIGTALNRGDAREVKSVDTDGEFQTLNGYAETGASTSNGVMTLPANGEVKEAIMNYDGFGLGSILRLKIDGFTNETIENSEARSGNIAFYFNDGPTTYVMLLTFDDGTSAPAISGNCENGTKDITTGYIDTTQPFEIFAKRVIENISDNPLCIEIWAKQIDSDECVKLGNVKGIDVGQLYGNKLQLSSGNDKGIKLDYIKIYEPNESAFSTVSDLTVDDSINNELAVSGTIHVGYAVETFESEASVYAVAYDKKYGYQTFIDKHNVTLTKGSTTNISHTFNISAVNAMQENLGVFAWDSSNKALCDAWGYTPLNIATGKAAMGQSRGMVSTAHFNEVRVVGYAGEPKATNVTIVIKNSSGDLTSIAQVKTNSFGMLDTTIGINPYLNTTDTYTVAIKIGSIALEDTMVNLICDDSFDSYEITDAATFNSFIQNFGSDSEKANISLDGIADKAYAKFVEIVGEGSSTDYFSFAKLAPLSLELVMKERAFVAEFNEAIAYERWSVMQTLITTTYSDILGITSDDISDVNGVNSQKDLFLRIPKTTYTTKEEIVAAFRTAVTEQKAAESTVITPSTPSAPSLGGGGGGGGGGFAAIKDDKPLTDGESQVPTTKPEEPLKNNDFIDIDGVEWAKESINNLKKLRILSGDGTGNFYPERNITREEFLKLVIEVLDIESTGKTEPAFKDVDKNSWYYPYVKIAYQHGIVTGMSDEIFGAGTFITRADMATLMNRALSIKDVEMKLVRNAIVSDDVRKIPQYARDSVNMLYRIGLLNGKSEGIFVPMDNTTRAEAAVLIDRVLKYIGSIQ